MQHLPRPGRPNAADVQLRIVANGMVPGLPSRAREKSAASRPGLQHALRAADKRKACSAGWQGLYRPAFARQRFGEEIQLAHGDRHHELFNVSPMIWK